MSFQKIKIAIESRNFQPIYFLCGEESYYIDSLTDLITEKALTDSQRDFNQHLFYGKDSDPQDIVNIARRYPVFSDRQLIIVKEAQHFKNWDAFLPYVQKPVDSTILVFNFKHQAFDKRTTFAKLIVKNSVFLESKKIKEESIPEWITEYLKSNSYKIDHKSAFLLKEHLGNDLSKIVNELNKLILNVKQGESIRDHHIEEFIGISKDFNAFELSKAIETKDYLKAMTIVNYFEHNPKAGPLIFVLTLLFNYFSRIYQLHHTRGLSDSDASKAMGINPYFFRDYKEGIQRYDINKTEAIIADIALIDARSKGIGNASIGDYELLKELIFTIMH